jgi:hypothetical protein
MHTWELALASVLFLDSFLKWTALGLCRFIFMKGSNMRKIKTKAEFRNGRPDVIVNCTSLFVN